MSLVGIGHNQGDITASQQISDNLREKHKDLVDRAAQLDGMDGRAPDITDQTVADKVSEAVRQCMAFEKATEGTRVAEKQPYLDGGRAVDGFFQNLVKPVLAAHDGLLRKLTVWQRKIDDERRAQLQREADERDRQAREAAAAAAKAKSEAAFQEADRAAVEAEEAQRVVTTTSTADLTRTRTDAGVVSSLRSEWRFEVVDTKAVPRKFCMPVDGLIRAAVKAAVTADGECPLEIKGVRIYKHTFSQVR